MKDDTYIKWLQKRIDKLKKQYEASTDLERKKMIGAKLVGYKQSLDYYITHYKEIHGIIEF